MSGQKAVSLILLLVLALASGCAQPEPKTQYVCSDKNVVSDPSLCETEKQPAGEEQPSEPATEEPKATAEPQKYSFPDNMPYLTIDDIAEEGYVVAVALAEGDLGYKKAVAVAYENKIDNTKIAWVSYVYSREVSDTNYVLEYNELIPKVKKQYDWMKEIEGKTLGGASIILKGTNYEKLDKLFGGNRGFPNADVYAREGDSDHYLFVARKNKLIVQVVYNGSVGSDQNKVIGRIEKYMNLVFDRI